MNIRNVLRIYTLERQLNADDIALLNTLRAMNDSEREALVETLSPQPVKKAGKKSASKKSSRASGMQAQLNTRLAGRERERQGIPTTRAVNSSLICHHRSDDGDDPTECGLVEDNPIHDPLMGYGGYHPFDPGARPANDSSSANGGAGGGTQSLEDETVSAAVATGGSNE